MAYEHLKNRMDELGKTQNELVALLGRTAPTATYLFKGEKELKPSEAKKVALWIGKSPQWVLFGSDTPMISVNEVIGENGLIQYTVPDEHVGCPEGYSPDDVMAAKVETNILFPAITSGSTVIYAIDEHPQEAVNMPHGTVIKYNQPSPADPYAELFDRPCIVELQSGEKVMSGIRPGILPGHYTLFRYTSPETQQVKVKAAYKIIASYF